MSEEGINSIKTSNYIVILYLDYYGNKIKVKFNRTCLKQGKIAYNHRKIVDIYIVYEISKSINISDYPTLETCLFGAVGLTKTLISISTSILDMELDLIDMEFFHFLALD